MSGDLVGTELQDIWAGHILPNFTLRLTATLVRFAHAH
jgi:hypothetical protein